MNIMHGCAKCSRFTIWLVLLFGIVFLLADFGLVNFPINWWTAVFLIIGITHLAMGKCKDCRAMCCGGTEKKGKRK
ncbi:MAG: hypothetical protein ABIH34_07825 [Nanoarchaeota archaeon]